MQITRLSIKNVRAIEHLELDLALSPGKPRRRVILLGVNGAGKTTILDAITHAFEGLAETLDMGGITLGAADVRNVEDPTLGSEVSLRSGAVHLHAVISEEEQRMTPLFSLGAPAEGELSFLIGDPFDFDVDVDGNANHDLTDEDMEAIRSLPPEVLRDVSLSEDDSPGAVTKEPEAPVASTDLEIDEESGFQDAVTSALVRQRPPCLFLAADRGVLEDREDVPIKGLRGFDPRVECLSRSRERFATLAARLALATIDSRSESHRAVARMWKAVEKYFPEMPALASAEGLQLRFRNKRGGLVPLSALSDGERAVLLILGEVALRAPASGVILIDELEQHLHPRWQRAILQALLALAPSAQLIITTQSPYLAAGASDDVIKIGEWDRDGE